MERTFMNVSLVSLVARSFDAPRSCRRSVDQAALGDNLGNPQFVKSEMFFGRSFVSSGAATAAARRSGSVRKQRDAP